MRAMACKRADAPPRRKHASCGLGDPRSQPPRSLSPSRAADRGLLRHHSPRNIAARLPPSVDASRRQFCAMSDDEGGAEYHYSDDEDGYVYDDGGAAAAAPSPPRRSAAASATTSSVAASAGRTPAVASGGAGVGSRGAAGSSLLLRASAVGSASSAADYRLLAPEEIERERNRVISDVSAIVSLPPDTTHTLLVHFRRVLEHDRACGR